jgi:hypothetical protein
MVGDRVEAAATPAWFKAKLLLLNCHGFREVRMAGRVCNGVGILPSHSWNKWARLIMAFTYWDTMFSTSNK